MSKNLHSGHLHLAARELPNMPAGCSPHKVHLQTAAYQAALAHIGGKLILPRMPEAILSLKKAIEAPHPNLNQIVEQIESNPILSGDMIRTASQPVFQRKLINKVEITNITQCVTLIGLERTYQIALSSAMKQLLQHDPRVKNLVDYAAKTAYACAEIAGYLPPHDPPIKQERAYLFGLYLHGGMFALATRYPDTYMDIVEQSLNLPKTAYQHEREQFAPHTLLGVVTAMDWGLNPENAADLDLLLAIHWHHHEHYACIQQVNVRLLIAMGLLAQTLVSELGLILYQSQELAEQATQAASVLGLSEEALTNIRKNLSSYWLPKAIE